MSRNYGELTKYSFLLGHRFRCPTDDESCTSLKVIERERAWDGADDRGMRDNLRVTWLLREEEDDDDEGGRDQQTQCKAE